MVYEKRMESGKSRFCYSYKPPSAVEVCCPTPNNKTADQLSTIRTIPSIINNSTQTSDRTLLLQQQKQFTLQSLQMVTQSTILYTLQNQDYITSTLNTQLITLQKDRYVPFQPYIYPVIPLSVTQLQMATANVGVPMPDLTGCAKAKGSQFTTT